MKKSLVFLSLLAVGTAGAAGATTIYSDDFESNSTGLNTTPAGWTLDSGSVDVIGDGFYDIYGPGIYVDMNGTTGEAGAISTTISGLTVGESYTLTFDLAYNTNSGNQEQLSFSIGDLSDSYGPPIDSPPGGFLTLSYTFTATATSELLSFADTGTSPGDNGGPVIDNILITTAAVPLPAAGLLLLGGLGGLGVLRRRKMR